MGGGCLKGIGSLIKVSKEFVTIEYDVKYIEILMFFKCKYV